MVYFYKTICQRNRLVTNRIRVLRMASTMFLSCISRFFLDTRCMSPILLNMSGSFRKKQLTQTTDLESKMQGKDCTIQEMYFKTQDKDCIIEEMQSKIQEKNCIIQEMQSKIQEKDSIIQKLEERLKLMETQVVTDSNCNSTFESKKKRRHSWCGPRGCKPNMSGFQMCANLSPIKAPQIAFPDFKLELMNNEANREEDSDKDTFVTDCKDNRVKFIDDLLLLIRYGARVLVEGLDPARFINDVNMASPINYNDSNTTKKDYEHEASELRTKLNEAEQENILLKNKLTSPSIAITQPSLNDETVSCEQEESQCKITDQENKLPEPTLDSNSMKLKLDELQQKTIQNEKSLLEMQNKFREMEIQQQQEKNKSKPLGLLPEPTLDSNSMKLKFDELQQKTIQKSLLEMPNKFREIEIQQQREENESKPLGLLPEPTLESNSMKLKLDELQQKTIQKSLLEMPNKFREIEIQQQREKNESKPLGLLPKPTLDSNSMKLKLDELQQKTIQKSLLEMSNKFREIEIQQQRQKNESKPLGLLPEPTLDSNSMKLKLDELQQKTIQKSLLEMPNKFREMEIQQQREKNESKPLGLLPKPTLDSNSMKLKLDELQQKTIQKSLLEMSNKFREIEIQQQREENESKPLGLLPEPTLESNSMKLKLDELQQKTIQKSLLEMPNKFREIEIQQQREKNESKPLGLLPKPTLDSNSMKLKLDELQQKTIQKSLLEMSNKFREIEIQQQRQKNESKPLGLLPEPTLDSNSMKLKLDELQQKTIQKSLLEMPNKFREMEIQQQREKNKFELGLLPESTLDINFMKLKLDQLQQKTIQSEKSFLEMQNKIREMEIQQQREKNKSKVLGLLPEPTLDSNSIKLKLDELQQKTIQNEKSLLETQNKFREMEIQQQREKNKFELRLLTESTLDGNSMKLKLDELQQKTIQNEKSLLETQNKFREMEIQQQREKNKFELGLLTESTLDSKSMKLKLDELQQKTIQNEKSLLEMQNKFRERTIQYEKSLLEMQNKFREMEIQQQQKKNESKQLDWCASNAPTFSYSVQPQRAAISSSYMMRNVSVHNCSCKTGCGTRRCGCRKIDVRCNVNCKCGYECEN